MLTGRQPGQFFIYFYRVCLPSRPIRRIRPRDTAYWPSWTLSSPLFLFLIMNFFQICIRRIHLGDTPYCLFWPYRSPYPFKTGYGVFTHVIRRIGYLDTVTNFLFVLFNLFSNAPKDIDRIAYVSHIFCRTFSVTYFSW